MASKDLHQDKSAEVEVYPQIFNAYRERSSSSCSLLFPHIFLSSSSSCPFTFATQSLPTFLPPFRFLHHSLLFNLPCCSLSLSLLIVNYFLISYYISRANNMLVLFHQVGHYVCTRYVCNRYTYTLCRSSQLFSGFLFFFTIKVIIIYKLCPSNRDHRFDRYLTS